jgi:hypothetical protein
LKKVKNNFIDKKLELNQTLSKKTIEELNNSKAIDLMNSPLSTKSISIRTTDDNNNSI